MGYSHNLLCDEMMTSYLSLYFSPLCNGNIISSHKTLGKCHSFMKHRFFSVRLFVSPITKNLRRFSSLGIFPFTGNFNSPGFYRAGFFHSPWFFLSSRRFFPFPFTETLIFIQNSKIFEEIFRRFFSFSEKKTIKYSC